ncbi:MAG: hypothetical protein ABI464_11780 [Chthoniobacteraceae bacterium]
MDALIIIFLGVAIVPLQVCPEFQRAFGAFQVSGLAMWLGWVVVGFRCKTPVSGQKGCLLAISPMTNAAFAMTNSIFVRANAAFAMTISAFARTNSTFAMTKLAFVRTNLAFAMAIGTFVRTNAAFATKNAAFATANPAFAPTNAVWRRTKMTCRRPYSTPLCPPHPAEL